MWQTTDNRCKACPTGRGMILGAETVSKPVQFDAGEGLNERQTGERWPGVGSVQEAGIKVGRHDVPLRVACNTGEDGNADPLKADAQGGERINRGTICESDV